MFFWSCSQYPHKHSIHIKVYISNLYVLQDLHISWFRNAETNRGLMWHWTILDFQFDLKAMMLLPYIYFEHYI